MVFIKPIGGLCNRMRFVDSMISLCEKHNRDLTIIWLPTNDLNVRFHEIFEPVRSEKIKIRIIGNKNIYRLLSKYLIKQENLISNAYLQNIYFTNREKKGFSLKAADKRSFTDIKELSVQLLKKTGEHILIESCYRHCPTGIESYQYFKPVKHIRKKIENKVNTFNNTVGIHIRRTDNKRSIEVSTDDKIFEIIHKELQANSRKTFFLATDCASTKQKYKAAFKESIITNDDISFERNKRENIENAVLDLYCLSRTQKIYGSFFSSYSKVAAVIGDVDIEVIT